MTRNVIAALGLIGLGLVGACSGGGNTALTTVPTAHLAITLRATTVAAGTPFTFTVSALDATNAVVPTYIGTVHVATSDASATLPANATLARGVGTFTVTFGTIGSQMITASDTVGDATSGTSAAISVSLGVSINPATVTLPAGAVQAFTATVEGTSNHGVIWSVRENLAGGSITSAGVYTAPQTVGTYHVIAVSQADTSKSAVATITIARAPPPPGAVTGYFIDAPVSGLAYTCTKLQVGDTIKGVTDANGAFEYDADTAYETDCTFNIGGVTLGAPAIAYDIPGMPVTPRDLAFGVPGKADETTPEVTNIVRFLLTLNSSGDPNTLIAIDPGVATALSSSTLDFTNATTFDTQAQNLVNMVYPGRTLVAPGVAQAHLRATLLSLLTGTLNCHYYSGGTAGIPLQTLGQFQFNLANGTIAGTGTPSQGGSFAITGTVATAGAVTMTSSNGITFTGAVGYSGAYGSGPWTSGMSSGGWGC